MGLAQKSAPEKRVSFSQLSMLPENEGTSGHKHLVSDKHHRKKKEHDSSLAKEQASIRKMKKTESGKVCHYQSHAKKAPSGEAHHHHHHRHAEKLPGGEVCDISGSFHNLESHHVGKASHHDEPAGPSPAQKTKSRLSLSDYRQRRRVDDQKNSSTSEPQPRIDFVASKDTDSDSLMKSSLAEKHIMSYNKREQTATEMPVKAVVTAAVSPILEVDPRQNIKQSGAGDDADGDDAVQGYDDIFGASSAADAEVVRDGSISQLQKIETGPMGKTPEPMASKAVLKSPESLVEIQNMDTLNVLDSRFESTAETGTKDLAGKASLESPESPVESDTDMEPDEIVLPEELISVGIESMAKTGLCPVGVDHPVVSEAMAKMSTTVLASASNLETSGQSADNRKKSNEVLVPEFVHQSELSGSSGVTRDTSGTLVDSTGVADGEQKNVQSEDSTTEGVGSELLQAQPGYINQAATTVQQVQMRSDGFDEVGHGLVQNKSSDSMHRLVVDSQQPSGADASSTLTPTMLLEAAETGCVDVVTRCLAGGIDVNHRQPDTGSSSLMIAAEKGQLEVLHQLLEVNSYIDVIDNTGQTALIKAANAGHRAAVECLLDYGANVPLCLLTADLPQPVTELMSNHLVKVTKEFEYEILEVLSGVGRNLGRLFPSVHCVNLMDPGPFQYDFTIRLSSIRQDTHVFLFIGPARVKCESVTAGSLFDWRFFDHITLNSHRLEPFEPPAESIYDVDKSFLQDGRNRLVLNLHNVLCEHKHLKLLMCAYQVKFKP